MIIKSVMIIDSILVHDRVSRQCNSQLFSENPVIELIIM